jgi:DNA-binding LytR/AlgR family response regulator
MRFLIVDDERPARAELIHALNQLAPDIECVQARSGNEALKIIANKSVDVCFLDIQMPEMDGLELATRIVENKSAPLIVFATAFDDHAIRAFELNVLDYLVKPIKNNRLSQVLDRIQLLISQKEEKLQNLNGLRSFLASRQAAEGLRKLIVSGDQGSSVFIDYANIAWIEAKDRQIFVHTLDGKKYRISSTLRDLEYRLAIHGFFRVHKSYLVNLHAVIEIAPMFSGSRIIILADSAKTQIPLSRKYTKEFDIRLKQN